MDIKKFELFADVAETKNFTKSGDRMGYTQSGVSHILKSLETEIGFPLFIRTKQGVSLTKNAEMLLPLVHSLLAINENLEQTISDINGLDAGQLTIASFASISIHWLPEIVHRFQETYPGITITLLEGGTDEIVGWVEDSIADFGFMSAMNTKSLEWISMRDDPLMAVLPKDYPPPENGVFKVTDFQDQPFIITATGTDYDVHLALNQANITPQIKFTSKEDRAIVSMVANKLGFSILPKLVLKDLEQRVQVLPLEPYSYRNLGIAVKSRKNMSPAARKFLSLTRQMLPELQ